MPESVARATCVCPIHSGVNPSVTHATILGSPKRMMIKCNHTARLLEGYERDVGHDWRNQESYDQDDGSVVDW